MLLAGDIGGTKSALALFSREAGPRAPLRSAELPSREFASLEAVIHQFLGGDRRGVDRACFGVPGPVFGEVAAVTNLPWTVDAARLRAEFGFASVTLLNDVQATAEAIPALRAGDWVTLIEGEPAERRPIALLAPGTGLGEAFLTWEGSGYRAHASEGGHTDFAPRNEEQLRLLAHLLARHPHVSYERVCSAIGIERIYEYLRDTGYAPETPFVAQRLASSDDRARVIIEAAREGTGCALCVHTLQIFAAILGAEAGNLALKLLATGGVYLAGGIPRAVLPFLRAGGFSSAYTDKGRFSELLSAIPVRVVTADAALLGAALRGLQG